MHKAITISLIALALVGSALAADVRKATNIPAQELETALQALAKERELQIVFRSTLVKEMRTAGVTGELTSKEALEKLLNGTGLTYRYLDEKTITIGLAVSGARSLTATEPMSAGSGAVAEPASAAPDILQIAQADSESAPDTQNSEGGEHTTLEEIVVTGTHIRGAGPIGSPLIVRDRKYIESTGISTTEQLLRTLPQAFGGGISDAISASIFGGESNAAVANGPNLRGLGSEATLTLLNGLRTTGSGLGEAVDVAIFPLAAIDRVDILLDGASALYGSDAVGGVINVHLRRDFEGAETRVRYGSVTDGHQDEIVASQVLGTRWATGSGTLAYTYRDQNELLAGDRSFSSGADTAYTLLPAVRQHTVTVAAQQELSAATSLLFDALYSDRDSHQVFSIFGFAQQIPTTSTQLHLDSQLRASLSGDWSSNTSLAYSRSHFDNRTTLDGIELAKITGSLHTSSLESKADGTVLRLASGPVRAAVGGQFRREELAFDGFSGSDKTHRNVHSLFGELQVPLIAGANANGVHELRASVAGRYEDYSDFGSSFDPKFGLGWVPLSGVRLRGTWGTSFRAPRLYELNPIANPLAVEAKPVLDPASGSGSANVLVLNGSQPDLSAETSTNWTFGFDLTPSWADGLMISATYFDIDYEDQVGVPIPDSSRVLVDSPTFDEFIDRAPESAAVADYLALPNTTNPLGLTVADIMAVIDNRAFNTASNKTRGVDLSVQHGMDVALGKLALDLGATYLLKRDIRFTSATPPLDQRNDAYFPVDLKLRGGLTLTRRDLTVSAFVNHVDGYEARARDGLIRPVHSWTTADLTLHLDLSELFPSLPSGVSMNWAALNVFNTQPPRVETAFAILPIDFDPTNASPVGRFLSAELTVRW